jgi:pimeloyl-ACP methyl ester carboxylesterase
MFQGSFFRPSHHFDARREDPFGAYFQALTVKALLDAGFAVLVPETRLNGATFWDTNVPLWADAWSDSPDHRFRSAVFADVDGGFFGPLSRTRWHATGISSGGYMTSRMAVTAPERFRSVAIQSGSYATCAGPSCHVPSHFPGQHPPTLFLHGGQDAIVPQSTMESYRLALQQAGCDTREVIRENAGHEWLPEAPEAVLGWFLAHP